MRIPVTIICPVHRLFKQEPLDHLNVVRIDCLKCYVEFVSSKRRKEQNSQIKEKVVYAYQSLKSFINQKFGGSYTFKWVKRRKQYLREKFRKKRESKMKWIEWLFNKIKIKKKGSRKYVAVYYNYDLGEGKSEIRIAFLVYSDYLEDIPQLVVDWLQKHKLYDKTYPYRIERYGGNGYLIISEKFRSRGDTEDARSD